MCDDSMDSAGDVDFQPDLDMSAMPTVVKNRVKALKKLQFETVEAEELYYKEIHQIDLKYQKMYDYINEKRLKIVSGKHEPSGAEIEWPSDDEDEEKKDKSEEEIAEGVKKMSVNGYTDTTVGIPKFWFHVLRNANEECLMGMIAPYDEHILESLTNITVSLNGESENTGFTLFFHFADNEYFTNNILTKEYFLRAVHDKDCPLEYDGPEIFKSKGCKIEWKEGKDVTQKTIKVKTGKSGKGKAKKEVEEEVSLDSFFNFFSPPVVSDDPNDELSEEDKGTLAVDFDVGFAIKEKIVQRAVLYFTGELLDEDDFESCSDEDESEEDD